MRPQVFGILLVQLIVTFGMVVRCPRPRPVPPPILTRPHCAQLGLNQGLESECVRAEGPSGTCKTLYYVSWAVGFGTMIAIFCCKENAKIVPRCPPHPPPLRPLPRITQPDAWPGCLRRNYILLSICTVAEGLMLGVISSFYTTESVLLAAGAPSPPHPCQRTRGDEHGAARSRTVCGLILGAPDLCAGLTLIIAVFLIVFAFQTKYDFTGIGPYLMVALLCLVLFAFVMIIFTDSRVSATLRLLSD